MKLTNTLTKNKEDFKPQKERVVKIYVCGPTVYDHAHIGHARSYVFFDVLVRWLEYKGYDVIYVRNFTDIDDKIIKRAQQEKKSWKEIALFYEESFKEDMEKLKTRQPNIQPRVSDHIPEIIELIRRLLEKKVAYETADGVYFDISKFREYGKLSGKPVEDLLSGARIEPSPYKKNPLDFSLWKASKPGEPWWEAPWKKGRPGWHIECSAMSMAYLGETLDIHGGGEDLIFPHHENEIAQSEAATGKPFARYWVHNGLLRIKGEKMSKSLGNILTIKEILRENPAEAVRYFLLSAHYRGPLDFTPTQLENFREGVNRLFNFYQHLPEEERAFPEELKRFKNEFEKAMDDDFNTPKAISAIFKLVEWGWKNMDSISEWGGAARKLLKSLAGDVLGILPEEKREESKDFINLIVKTREQLRKRKIFDLADEIRLELNRLGISLMDTPEGTVWRRKL